MEYPIKIEAVYTENVVLVGGKLGACLRVLENGELSETELLFERKVLKSSFIGGVYEFEQTSEKAFRIAQRRYVRTFGDTGRVAAWQLSAKATELKEDAAKAERNSKSILAALALMEPLRAEYKKALPDRKRAIEILLLSYLRQ